MNKNNKNNTLIVLISIWTTLRDGCEINIGLKSTVSVKWGQEEAWMWKGSRDDDCCNYHL